MLSEIKSEEGMEGMEGRLVEGEKEEKEGIARLEHLSHYVSVKHFLAKQCHLNHKI